MGPPHTLEVFADISCPFAHVGLRRLVERRGAAGRSTPRLRVRAWPLEVVNGEPLRGSDLVGKVNALRAEVAPELFVGFDPTGFPATTRPALALAAAAYRGDALFEEGADLADPDVLDRVRRAHRVAAPVPADERSVIEDHAEGVRREVVGSPHFFLPSGSFLCPTLRIDHVREGLRITVDL